MNKIFSIAVLSGMIVTRLTANSSLADDLSVSYGVDLTSNYISKGSTQTQDRPAIQPY